MAYKKTFWKDRIVEKPNTYKQINNPDGTITLQPVFGQVIEQGTPFNAASLNKIEDGILDVYKHINLGGNFRIFKTIRERDKETNVEDGMICYVNEEGVYYARKNDEWEIFQSGSGGGGGGTSIGTLTSTCDGKTMSVSVGETLEVDLFFSTPNVGAGTVYVTSNGKEIQKKTISMGSNKIQLNLAKGSHKIEIYATDRAGVFTNIIQFTVQCGGLEISTDFSWGDNYKVGSPIVIPYNVETISKEPVVVHFLIGKQEFTQTATNKYNEFRLPTNLGANVYKVEIWATSGKFESNRITDTLVILNSDSLFVSTMFDKTEAEEGDQLIIDYRVSMEGVKDFDVVYSINGKEHSKGKAISGTNTFAISTLKLGDNTITIKVSTPDKKQEQSLTISIKIIQSSYELQKPIVDASLIAYADAYELSNFSPDREVWKDKKTGEVIGTLHNFNFNTNGWINNGLKMNGNAYAKLNIKPFLDNAPYGLTIDVEFETEDIGNENARVLDCTTKLGTDIGCFIDTSKAQIKSKNNEISSQFAQKEKTRVTYVIDRRDKITKLYINAVMSSVAKLTDKGEGANKQLEDFTHDDCIYLNSTRGLSNFGDSTVYSVKVYNRALTSDEILKNHIADIRDKALQKKKHDFNYKDTIPTMNFTCDPEEFKEMKKDRPVTLQIKYVSTNPTLYGQSFDLPNCEVKWQGTSSIVYDVKNYKIKLKDENNEKHKHALREGMIEESTFVLKADYMESSHANNTGLAKIVNKYLYDKDKKLPPQETNDKVVSAIDGFPIKLYLNGDLMGVFNFNLDKGNDKSFGFDKENENCISYEISANTDTTAGAFNKWTGPSEKYPTELDYLKADFELRFPDEKDEGKADYGYLNQLKKLVDWVSDADNDTFKREFEQHFNKEYTFKYYLFVLVMGMVDNLGKNMMICTWDGNIWYPCFYDLDTALSLDNSGYIKFDVDIEVEAKTYNTSGSKLWTKVWDCFKDELAAMYKDMRSKQFKEEKLFSILIDEQIDQIPELLYNEDSQKKYIDHPKYIHMLHGSRREHMRKWLTERLLYLDSKFGYEMNTGEAITVRANKTGNVEFKIKTYSPMYVKVKWRNDNNSIMLKKIKRNETVTFNYSLPTGTDQEILVYSAQHLKEIGDISDMKPSSLTLGSATRLTKLICKNSEYLQALGLGGEVDGVDERMKNLQEIDLTGCSKLGTIDSNRGLDVSYCDNLKTLKAQGTNLQNIQFNPAGGNLEELYLPNSMTELYLANQYNLRKVVFPSSVHQRDFNLLKIKQNLSQLTNLNIINCPNLVSFGLTEDVDSVVNANNMYNYKRELIANQAVDFPISKDEYIKASRTCCFGNLETVNISNSLLHLHYLCIISSPSIRTISFDNMPNLKGLIFGGNRSYVDNTIEGIAALEKIEVNKCQQFDSLLFQVLNWDMNTAFKFKEDYILDLSHLPLKKVICNMALENLKKIILPNTINEFNHMSTKLYDRTGVANNSRIGYHKTMSPLETIIIAGTGVSDDFKGIDLANKQLKNVNLNGLTQKVDIIKNVNCEAVDISPRLVSEHVSEQPLENIQINLNEFKGNSFYGTFKNTDMSKVQITLNNNITTQNMDYSEMFNNAKNVTWEKIQWLKKLPKGKIYKTFTHCDADRLDIGNMIGETTVDMQYCFQNMPKVTEIDLTGAKTNNVTSFQYCFQNMPKVIEIDLTGINTNNVNNFEGCFQNSTKLERLIGAENLIKEKCDNIKYMFNNTRKLKFSFPNNKPNWKLRAGKFQDTQCWLESCGRDVVLEENETNILDLREFGILSGNYYNGFCNEQYMGFTHFYGDGWDYTGTGTTSHDGKPNYSYCPNLVELHLTNCKFESAEAGIVYDNPNLVTLNLEGTDASKMRLRNTRMNFAKNPKLEHVTFLQNMKYPIDFSASTLLTEKSLLSILNGLADLKGSSPQAAKLGKANLDKLSESQKQIAIKKNWTLTE